jgi:hypothetical protein
MHAFAERFAAAWAEPTPDALVGLLHEDVVLLQPHRSPIRGRAAAHAEFVHLLRCLPELHGEIDRAARDDAGLFIEWRMKPLRNDAAAIRAIDRFVLRNGLAAERRVYFDQLALLRTVLSRPRLWAGFLRYRIGW